MPLPRNVINAGRAPAHSRSIDELKLQTTYLGWDNNKKLLALKCRFANVNNPMSKCKRKKLLFLVSASFC